MSRYKTIKYVLIFRYMSQLPVNTLSLVDSGVICDVIPGLILRQRRLCRQHLDIMQSVVTYFIVINNEK